MDVIHGNVAIANISDTVAPERYMVVRGSLKSKFPPALIIKSNNLRVLDPVGQG